MEIVLLVIGKTNCAYIDAGISDYEKRLRRYVPYKMTVLKDVKKNQCPTQEVQKRLEGETILANLSDGDRVVLLDERGKQFTSTEFAARLQERMASGLRRLVFVIGGPYGFSEEVYARANEMMSLSKMTFNHEMVRMFFTEQVYRAMTILRNEPYHH